MLFHRMLQLAGLSWQRWVAPLSVLSSCCTLEASCIGCSTLFHKMSRLKELWSCRQGDDATVLGANTIWILVIAGWTGGMMFPFFYLLKALKLLRVSEKEELVCPSPTSFLTASPLQGAQAAAGL